MYGVHVVCQKIRRQEGQPDPMEKRDVPILVYHSISHDTDPHTKKWTVSPEMFEEHLTYLRRSEYVPMTITELIEARNAGLTMLPVRPVILTFDDGYADFCEHALPALRRHDFVATLYVITGWVGGTAGKESATNGLLRRMVTWNQLDEVVANGMECGGHTHTHPKLDSIAYASARDEIVRCKSILEDHLGREVLSFAYPHGWYTRSLERMIRSAGYTSACVVKNMRSTTIDNAFELARLVVTDDIDVEGLEQLLARDISWGEVQLRNLARRAVRLVPRCQAYMMQYRPGTSAHHEGPSLEGQPVPPSA